MKIVEREMVMRNCADCEQRQRDRSCASGVCDGVKSVQNKLKTGVCHGMGTHGVVVEGFCKTKLVVLRYAAIFLTFWLMLQKETLTGTAL